ncbi:uncharacterized protein K02A2.6-like [Ostrea edulis]|uniref:uncharacterized protein K02A2.6-like n=1 Tax=Ostrea edulis TaxID=37623 RepID=UPI0024AFC13C|nr:uncharacterized protein K02A2.6-like [Ostrea edulis]
MSRLRKALEKLEESCIIVAVEATDWVNSLVIVEKKNGNLRLCLDPKDLNKAIKRQHFKIPTVQEIASQLNGKSLYTILDEKDGYHQVELDTETSYLCTFQTLFGRYRYKRLPFGISSASEVFLRKNMQTFRVIQGVQMIVDDMIIARKDETDHDETLRKNGKVIAYASKSMTDAEKNYAQIKKELLAVLFACEKFNPYIYGEKVLVQTDHKPLEDYYSRFIEIRLLKGTNAQSVVNNLKAIFSVRGIPEEIVSDNMPFNSHFFKTFTKEYNIKLSTSSTTHSQSNAMAERSMQTMKQLFNKAHAEGKDECIALLEYRNTPVTGMNYSPAQLLM